MAPGGPVATVVGVAAAGTGGHIYPGLAVAQALEELAPGVEVIFFTTRRGLGRELLGRSGRRVVVVDGHPVPFGLSWQLARAVGATLRGAAQAAAGLRRFRVCVLFATGGYGAVPVVLAARAVGVPVVWHEQNAWPGRATRLVGRLAGTVALGFEEARPHLPAAVASRSRVTGNPVRREIVTLSRQEGARRLELDPKRRTVLVVGASQGARRLNEAVVEAAGQLAHLEEGVQVLVSTGAAQFEEVARRLQARWPEGRRDGQRFSLGWLRVVAYLEDMAAALAVCDLAVSRAGAISIAEMTARGIPMVLVPYPYAAERHQQRNAEVVQRHGAALVVPDHELTAGRLVEVVQGLLRDPRRLAAMARASRTLGRPQAAQELAEMVVKAARSERACGRQAG